METIDKFDGRYRFLSNFWLVPIAFENLVYPSTENAYQAAKFPRDKREAFLFCSPAESKRLAKEEGKRKNWERDRISVMRCVLEQKFLEGSFLASKLLDTDRAELIEGNNWGDVFWGVCDGKGKNHLGTILMDIRQNLRLKSLGL